MPDLLADIIKSFHTNMEPSVQMHGELSNHIEVNNGLRQGCTRAPNLLNLYASVVVEN